MAMAAQGRFLVGSVISNSFEIYRRNFWSFSILTLLSYILLFVVIIFAVLGILLPFVQPTGTFSDPLETLAMASGGQIVTTIVVGLIAIVLCLAALQLAAAGICYGAAQDMRGQKASFGACLGRAFSVVLPVVGATILLLAIIIVVSAVLYFVLALISPWLGLLAFIPAAYIYIRYWVVIPVIVVERPGIIASLKRSLQLTRGEALRIFGILVILIGASVAVSTTIDLFGETAIGGILEILINIIISTAGAVVAATGYVELRRAKEGFGIEDLAAVFD